MATPLTRRSFLAAGAAVLGGGGNWAVAGPSADDAWALPVLGDLHLDRPEHHDAEWLKATHPNDVRQVENYCRVTREFSPKLFATVKAQVAAAKAPVPFVLQLGDLIEGLCGSDRLAAVQAGYATGFVREAGFPVPFLFTKGNHDVAGPGAADVYNRVFVPYLAKQANEEVTRAVFARRQGGWLVVF